MERNDLAGGILAQPLLHKQKSMSSMASLTNFPLPYSFLFELIFCDTFAACMFPLTNERVTKS